MKYNIIHCADLHIRGLQYLDEVQYTFDRLNEYIDKLFTENLNDKFCLVVAGDIFHSKLTVTNEYFVIAIDIFKRLADKLPIIIIPGNHDLSLPNKDRLDAITPFVKALDGKTKFEIFYSKHSESFNVSFVQSGHSYESYNDDSKIQFHHFSILDSKSKWPSKREYKENCVNIGLYHGSINNSEVDSGWTSRGNQDDISIFDGLDCVMLGDIHKSQFLTPTIAYPGSIRQNNFGETLDKGIIHWTIDENRKISGKITILPQKRYFITIQANKESDIKIPENRFLGSRVRVKLTKEIDIVDEVKIRNKIQELWQPSGDIEFILPDIIKNIDTRIELDSDKEILQENIRNIEVQKSLIDKFFENKDISEEEFQELYDLDKKYHTSIKTDVFRNIKWNIEEIEWDNLFSYGRDNKIDFKSLNGIIGLLGKNASGKSSIIDIITLTLFNNITKEGSHKNFDYINRKSKNAWSKMKISLDGEMYIIERGAKKIGKPEDEKVDNTIEFYKIDKDGNKKLLNGETKPDTNILIRDIFGNIDDFFVTSLCSQFGLSKFIDARGTERKKLISKIFDLDIFDEKYQLAVEHFKEIKSQLKLYDIGSLTKDIEINKNKIVDIKFTNSSDEDKLSALKKEISSLEESLFNKAKKIYNFEQKYDKNELLKRKKLLEEDIDYNNQWIEKLQRTNENLNFKGTKEEVEEFKSSFLKKKNHLKVLQAQLDSNIKSAELLQKTPGQEICKTCPLVEHSWKASEKLISLKNEIEQTVFNNEELNYNKLQEDVTERFFNDAKITACKKNIISFQEKISNIIEQIKFYDENEEKINHNIEIEKEIEELKQQKIQKEKELHLLENDIKNIQKEIAITEAKIAILSSKLEDAKVLNHKYYIYSLYLEAMGKNGISFWILSKKIPVLNNVVNRILSNIWKMKVVLEDNNEEKTIKIYCIDESSRRPVELLSGAERAVVSLAFRAALWYISALPKGDILILDEAFSHIESGRVDSVIKALSYLKNFFKNILIITHDEDLKSSFDHLLYINKNNGFSKLGV